MITNSSGKIAKLIKSLSNKKRRDEFGLFVAEGSKFVAEIPDSVNIMFYACTDIFYKKYKSFKFRDDVCIYTFSEKAFCGISETTTPQGILAVCEKMNYDAEDLFLIEDGMLLVLEGIRDPGNLGTIIRAADAAGVKSVILSDNTVDIFNPKVLRATMGSVFRLPFAQGLNIELIIEKLKDRNITVYGTVVDASIPYYNCSFIEKSAVIIGGEDSGMTKKARDGCDKLIKIPIVGGAESLNAAIAASIIMYEALRQRKIL